jgi:hypothetical protein
LRRSDPKYVTIQPDPETEEKWQITFLSNLSLFKRIFLSKMPNYFLESKKSIQNYELLSVYFLWIWVHVLQEGLQPEIVTNIFMR